MFSAKEYRAKAAEYAERGRTAEAPNEILEYENLWRRYAEMADNKEWVERNFKKTMHDDREADERCRRSAHPALPRGVGANGNLVCNGGVPAASDRGAAAS